MMGDFMATLGMLLALVGIIAASWAVSRFLGRRFGTPSSGKTIQILEQVPLGTDRSILLVRCQKHTYLLGSSQAGIHLIDKMEEGEYSDE